MMGLDHGFEATLPIRLVNPGQSGGAHGIRAS